MSCSISLKSNSRRITNYYPWLWFTFHSSGATLTANSKSQQRNSLIRRNNGPLSRSLYSRSTFPSQASSCVVRSKSEQSAETWEPFLFPTPAHGGSDSRVRSLRIEQSSFEMSNSLNREMQQKWCFYLDFNLCKTQIFTKSRAQKIFIYHKAFSLHLNNTLLLLCWQVKKRNLYFLLKCATI